MKYGTELFRNDKWVLRSRGGSIIQCMILHECEEKSNNKTLSDVYHAPLHNVSSILWQCTKCKKVATEDIITLWLMLNWGKMNRDNGENNGIIQ